MIVEIPCWCSVVKSSVVSSIPKTSVCFPCLKIKSKSKIIILEAQYQYLKSSGFSRPDATAVAGYSTRNNALWKLGLLPQGRNFRYYALFYASKTREWTEYSMNETSPLCDLCIPSLFRKAWERSSSRIPTSTAVKRQKGVFLSLSVSDFVFYFVKTWARM